MFLGIIIPIYNVEKYLVSCLDSCINQDIDRNDYEIICIDDGSTDNCGHIIDDYSKKYPNIVTVHKPNGGLSSARNAGLDIAKGNYIWFIDSDDVILENCLSGIKEYVLEKQSVITRLKAVKFFDHDSIEQIKCRIAAKPDSIIHNMIWSFIFQRNVIEDNALRFEEEVKFAEDTIFMIRISPYIPLLNTTPIYDKVIAYYYRQREGSLLRSSTEKKVAERLTMLPILKEYMAQDVDERECLYLIYYNVAYIMSYYAALPKEDVDEKITYLKSIGYFPLKHSKKYMRHSTVKGERLPKRITHILNDRAYTRFGYFLCRLWHRIKKHNSR